MNSSVRMYAVRTTIVMPQNLKLQTSESLYACTLVRTKIGLLLSLGSGKSLTYEGFCTHVRCTHNNCDAQKFEIPDFREFVRMYARTHNNLIETIIWLLQILYL